MPELDEILADDARRRHIADGPTSAFAPALDRALGTARHRRVRTIGTCALAATAIAAGSLLAVNSGPTGDESPQQLQLAAYDTVLGHAPGNEGSVYVVGPKDEHTASCTVVPEMTVTVQQPAPDEPSDGLSVRIKLGPGTAQPSNADLPFTGPGGFDLSVPADALEHGPLYVFSCPNG